MKFARKNFHRGDLRVADSCTDLFYGRQNRAGYPTRDYAPRIFLWVSGSGLGMAGIVSGAIDGSRAMIPPSVLEKISYGIALIVLFSLHRLPVSVLAIGSMDWLFAFLFLAAYLTTKSN
jgi:hypothetical protein